MAVTKTQTYGNWRYYRSGPYVYCWTTQRQPLYNNKYVSFVRRWHKTKSRYVTVDSKTATHGTRAKAKQRAERLAGIRPAEVKKPKPKAAVAPDEAYCMSCKGPRKVDNPEQIERVTRTGKVRHALIGKCSECGTNVTKFVANRRECPVCHEQRKESEFIRNDYVCRECRY
jgi:hypothetical protein